MKNFVPVAVLLGAWLFIVSGSILLAGDAYHPTDPRQMRRSIDPTEAPAGWIYNPDVAAVASTNRLYWKWNGDTTAVIPMTQGERDAVDQTRDRRSAFSQAVDAELRLLGLRALRDRLLAQVPPKNTTLIDARIATLDARLTNAVGRLP